MGRLGTGKRVASVCRNLKLLENKPTGSHKSIHYLEESVISIICNQNYQVLYYFVFIIRSNDLFKQSGRIKTTSCKDNLSFR